MKNKSLKKETSVVENKRWAHTKAREEQELSDSRYCLHMAGPREALTTEANKVSVSWLCTCISLFQGPGGALKMCSNVYIGTGRVNLAGLRLPFLERPSCRVGPWLESATLAFSPHHSINDKSGSRHLNCLYKQNGLCGIIAILLGVWNFGISWIESVYMSNSQ